jgi:hypothetical protein
MLVPSNVPANSRLGFLRFFSAKNQQSQIIPEFTGFFVFSLPYLPLHQAIPPAKSAKPVIFQILLFATSRANLL